MQSADGCCTTPAPGAPTAYLDIYTPDSTGGGPRPVILWVHGGGFISSAAATVADYAILLAHAGYTVASLDYSLAPGVRYPAPVRQGNAALAYLRASRRPLTTTGGSTGCRFRLGAVTWRWAAPSRPDQAFRRAFPEGRAGRAGRRATTRT